MASPSPQPNFNFTYHGQIGRDIIYSSIQSNIGQFIPVVRGIKSLEQWIYTNPNDYKGITKNVDVTSCTPSRTDIAPPTNKTPFVEEFELGASTCVRRIAYDQAGDFTHYQDRRLTGMAGFRGLAGYQSIFAQNLGMGMANDGFMRVWFADPATTEATSILDTNKTEGIWTQLLANSTNNKGGAFDTAFQGTDLPNSVGGADAKAAIDDLLDNSYITLRNMPASDKVIYVTPRIKYALTNYLSTVTGSDANFQWIQRQSQEAALFYRGIQIVEVYGWEECLTTASGGAYYSDLSLDTQELILYTARTNCWALTDEEGDVNRFETIYDPTTKTVLYDGNYMLGSFIIDFGLCAFAKQNLVP